jgi:hypothetical protein
VEPGLVAASSSFELAEKQSDTSLQHYWQLEQIVS